MYSASMKYAERMSGPLIASILLTRIAVLAHQSMSRRAYGSAIPAVPEGVLTVCCEGCGLQTHHLIETLKQ